MEKGDNEHDKSAWCVYEGRNFVIAKVYKARRAGWSMSLSRTKKINEQQNNKLILLKLN